MILGSKFRITVTGTRRQDQTRPDQTRLKRMKRGREELIELRCSGSLFRSKLYACFLSSSLSFVIILPWLGVSFVYKEY